MLGCFPGRVVCLGAFFFLFVSLAMANHAPIAAPNDMQSLLARRWALGGFPQPAKFELTSQCLRSSRQSWFGTGDVFGFNVTGPSHVFAVLLKRVLDITAY